MSPLKNHQEAFLFADDEADSGTFDLAEQSVLLMAEPGDDLRGVATALGMEGYLVMPVRKASEIQRLGVMPRYAILDTAALTELESLGIVGNEALPNVFVVALLAPEEPEGPALARGALVTLRRPVVAFDLLLVLNRFRALEEGLTAAEETDDRASPRASEPLIESLLAAINHEVRNPLAAAMANLGVLRASDDRDRRPLPFAERRAIVDETHTSLARIAEIITVVSSLVKGGELPALEPMPLSSVVSSAVSVVQDESVKITLRSEEEIYGWANFTLLENVVVTLLRNAIEATKSTPEPRIAIRIYGTSTEARISVRHNGPELTESERERVFEPFMTTCGDSGNGIGLSLARHAVTRMGGTLTLGPAESGTVLRVRLSRVGNSGSGARRRHSR